MSMSAFRKMKLQRDLQERMAKIEQTAVTMEPFETALTDEPVVAVPTEEPAVETVPTEEPVVEATAKTDAEKLKKRK